MQRGTRSDRFQDMTKRRERMLKKLLTGRDKYSIADIQYFVAYYAKSKSAILASDCEQVLAMFGSAAKKSIQPPAGLRAKQAVPIMIAYVQEELGKQVSLSKEEKGSFSALVAALDRRFGQGFTERVISELNAIPNGATSLHYRR